MAIVVNDAQWDSDRGNGENDSWLKVIVSQQEWQEVAPMCKWIPGEVQVAVLADWGNGKVVLGTAVYNGFTHVATGGAGGFRVSFKSDIESLEWLNIINLKKACSGKTEDTQHTFQFLVLTAQEAMELLKKRKKQNQSIADVINEEEEAEEG